MARDIDAIMLTGLGEQEVEIILDVKTFVCLRVGNKSKFREF